MSVDKFGRRSTSGKPLRGPRGEGFNLTPQGDYDMKNKRLRYVEDPVESQDVVNLKTFLTGIVNCIQTSVDSTEFDAQMKRIGNADEPINASDLTTKRYVDEKVPEEKEGFWSFKHKRLSNVLDPLYDGEVVNIAYLKRHSLVKDSKTNMFDAKNTVIANLAPPSNDSDAVNKGYLENNVLLLKDNNEWNFKNKKLVNVENPEGNDKDAINFGFLNNYALCRIRDGKRDWDGRQGKIKYVDSPVDEGDVVNKKFLIESLADLSYEIYKQLMITKKKQNQLYPYNMWKDEVLHVPWSDLFKKHK